MVLMALDHTRDYFHAAAYIYSPTDPMHTTWAIYLTRWTTHFCAPAFSFLAGMSAFMVGRRRTTGALSGFLLKRGLWLVFIELTVVNFAWFFDIHFRTPCLLVIWSLGISMIVLAGLVYLPRTAILIFSCMVIFGHNVLDGVHFNESFLWAVIHDRGSFFLNGYHLSVGYPIVPWIAVMSLGYCLGSLYNTSYDSGRRKKTLNIIGLSAIALFIIIRGINIYGDPAPWTHYDTISRSLMSFFNPNKYPPSLLYLLMTLGPSLIFLANSENLKGSVVNFFCTFGRVPFFFYILHIYLIHLVALVFAQLSGLGWRVMILNDWVSESPALKGYGFSLWVVYAVWIGVIVSLYPLCKKFDAYKGNHKEKWWLSYL
jgi:uncharacterized membrane protein